MTDQTVSGKCLCGDVQFEADVTGNHVGVCHCSMCRTWSGGPFMVLLDVKGLKIANEEPGIYKSSDYGERCFCKTCGSNLFWRSEALGHTAVSAGAIDSSFEMVLTSEIYIDSKPAFYEFANDTTKMTEADVIAAFAPGQSQSE